KTFAFDRLPAILQRQTTNYENVVGSVAQTVHDLAGARDGIAFLLDRIEQEPAWFRFNNQDAWSRHSGTLASWRREAKNLGDLEERLLRFVTLELRRDLETHQARNRIMYHQQQHHDSFWAEKTEAFARVAEEVLARQNKSGVAVQYIAEYLYWGLG